MSPNSKFQGWSRWLTLCLLLGSQLAFAQNVLVLDLPGDRRNRLRNQVVSALQDTGEVKLVPIREFESAARSAGLRGSRATNDAAVARFAPEIGADLAVGGKVSRNRFTVRFLDSKGQEIYSRTLKLRRGRLSKSNAKKLARAIITAVATLPPPAPPPVETTDRSKEIIITPEGEGSSLAAGSAQGTSPGATDDTSTSVSDSDLELDLDEPVASRTVGPTTIKLRLGGVTTWRNYCAHPGVGSCSEFTSLPEGERPGGVSVSFKTPIPYAGFGVGLDLFPLANAGLEGLQGLGAVGSYSRGFSLTQVNRRSDTGETEPESVVSVDESWMVALAYRFYFGLGQDEAGPVPAYIGARAGYGSRAFDVDPTATVGLTGSHRRFPQAGLDVSIPIIRKVRVEASALYFFGPKAGQEELNDYGSSVRGTGFGIEAGLAGDVWGPLGYELKFRMMSFKDRFEGAGARWSEGGAAEENYAGVSWGLTAGF